MYRKILLVTAVASRLAEMKMDMPLSAKQEAAWSAFASTVKQQQTVMMSAMQARMKHASGVQTQQCVPNSADEYARLMKQRMAGTEAVAAAMTQLYAVLTPQQKKILDARIGREMPM